MGMHQRILADDELVAAVAKALPIVAQLAKERAKTWPRLNQLHARGAHRARLAELESELNRVAANFDGVTGNEIEQLGRAELKRRGRSVPAVAPDIVERSPEAIKVIGEYLILRDSLEEQIEKRSRIEDRIDAVRAALRVKEAEIVRIGAEVPAPSARKPRRKSFTGRGMA